MRQYLSYLPTPTPSPDHAPSASNPFGQRSRNSSKSLLPLFRIEGFPAQIRSDSTKLVSCILAAFVMVFTRIAAVSAKHGRETVVFPIPTRTRGKMTDFQPQTPGECSAHVRRHVPDRRSSGGIFFADGSGSSFPAYSDDPELQHDRIELGAQIFVRVLLTGSATRCNFQDRDQRSGTPI